MGAYAVRLIVNLLSSVSSTILPMEVFYFIFFEQRDGTRRNGRWYIKTKFLQHYKKDPERNKNYSHVLSFCTKDPKDKKHNCNVVLAQPATSPESLWPPTPA